MAFPGIRSAYTVGLGELSGAIGLPIVDSGDVNYGGYARRDFDAAEGVDVPLADAYSLRVNVSRRLYDRGIAMQGSPALANLAETTSLHSTTSTSTDWAWRPATWSRERVERHGLCPWSWTTVCLAGPWKCPSRL